MGRRTCLALPLLCVAAVGARADERVSAVGAIDLRLVHSDGATSYLEGGPGLLRFDSSDDGLHLGRAFVALKARVTDIASVHAVIDTYGDHDRNPVDLSELWLELKPYPASALRWRGRIGAFYMPVSLENRGPGWSSVYALTPSAINTWFGEEFRTIGAEVEARWLGAPSGYLGDLALVAAAYGWNDPAGVLIADRGFALSDRPSTLFGGLGRPPMTFYHEIDRRPGYYAGLSWRAYDRVELRALRYDNRADPGASTLSGNYAWLTRFSTAGVRFEPTARWTFITQYVDGSTWIGPDSAGDLQFRMTYHSAFALTSFERGPDRLTARYDGFGTHQSQGFYGPPPADQSGHAWTLAWTHELGDDWQLAAEWLRVTSNFPPRLAYGGPPGLVESQYQIAVRYRFRFGF